MRISRSVSDASAGALRARTEARLLEALRAHSASPAGGFRSPVRAMTRVELGETAAVSRPSVHTALGNFSSRVVECIPGGPVRLLTDAGYVLAVECGTHQARVAIADLAGHLYEEREPFEQRFPFGEAPSPYLDWVAEAIERLLQAADVKRKEVIGLGISRAAPVDRETGLAHESGLSNADWRDINVGAQLTRRLPWLAERYLTTDNDASLSALAEHLAGAARGVDDFVYVKWSDSIATGLFLSGRPYAGSTGYAGQMGHLLIDWRSGRGALCRVCGKNGCLETKVGAMNMAEQLGLDTDVPRIADALMERASDGSAVLDRLEQAAYLMGEALAPVVDTLDPGCIVLGGWLGSDLHDRPELLSVLRNALEGHVMGFARDISIRRPEMRRSTLHGAALRVLDAHFVEWARSVSEGE